MEQKIICSVLLVIQLLGAVLSGWAFGRELKCKCYNVAYSYKALMMIFLICFAITMFAGLFI